MNHPVQNQPLKNQPGPPLYQRMGVSVRMGDYQRMGGFVRERLQVIWEDGVSHLWQYLVDFWHAITGAQRHIEERDRLAVAVLCAQDKIDEQTAIIREQHDLIHQLVQDKIILLANNAHLHEALAHAPHAHLNRLAALAYALPQSCQANPLADQEDNGLRRLSLN